MMSSRIVALLLGGCLFSAVLSAQPCPITVSAGPDKYLCLPSSPTQLEGEIDGTYLNFSWSPTTGMTGSNSLTPNVNVTTTTTYVLKAKAVNTALNLIDNGDFEQGNVGFSSDYGYSPGDLVPEGLYDVIDNPQADHAGFQPCPDHTSGSGNMMVVNGSGTPNQNVWCQTISGLLPNTQYAFSAWVATVVAASPARLQFEINGSTIGPIFNAPSGTCVWQNFYALWTNGAGTSATICILNQNTTLGGNDFALDDLSFAPVCEVTDTVTVHAINIMAKAAPTVVTIPCEGSNITLSGAGSSTGANITYLWETGNGNIVSGETTLSPVVNAAGTYTLTVSYEKDGFVCTKTASISVTESSNPFTAWITPPLPLGCGSPTLTLLGNSTQPGITSWLWEASAGGNIVSGSTARNAVVDKPGTYTLTATNNVNGCTSTTEVQVTVAANPPAANATSTGAITCLTSSVPLNGTGSSTGANITYLWFTANGSITGGTTVLNTTAGSGGTYILAVTNTQNGCITYDTVTVPANTAAPSVSIATPGVLDCDTDTLTLAASFLPQNLVLHWTTTGGNIASGDSTANPRVTLAGNYRLIGINPANGCADTASVTVTGNYTKPLAVVQPADSITCQTSSVTLSGSGSSVGTRFRYKWTAGAGGNIVSGDNTLSPVVNAPATYTLVVTDTLNACTASATISVVADQNIVLAVANAPDTLTCLVKTVSLNANGSTTLPSITYLWTTLDGQINGPTNGPTATAAQPGTYQLRVTNTANGCSATDLAVVAADTAAPKISITPTEVLTCEHPERDIHATNLSLPGVFEYTWTTDTSGNILSGFNTLTPTVNSPGVYTLIVRNLKTGCTATYTTAVGIANDVPIVTANVPGPLTCANLTRSLGSTVSPAGGNIAYSWTVQGMGNIVSGNTTATPVVDQPGTYNLLITNATNGCTATASVVVLQNKIPPPAEAGPNATLTCTAPTFTLSGNTGQTGAYTYQWSSPSGHFVGNPNTAQVLCDSAGLYRLLVTDPANGCTATDSTQVTANQIIPQLQLTPADTLTCTVGEVSFSVGITPAGFHTTQWTTLNGHFTAGQNTPMPSVDKPGFYSLSVVNAVNGCTATASLSVAQDTASPKISIPPSGPITCAALTRSITAQQVSPSGNFNYAWSSAAGGSIVGPTNGLSISVNAGGTYTLLTTNLGNGCTATASVTVAQNTQLPTASAGLDDTLTCNLQTLTLNGTASSEPGLTFVWTASNGGNIQSGGTTLSPVIDKPGTYSLLVTNPLNGCTASDIAQIFNDLNTPQANAGKADTLTCVRLSTNLAATASSGATFSYLWTTSGTGNILSGHTSLAPLVDNPGTYTLAVTNSANGCVSTSTVVVPENVKPPVVSAGADAVLTCAVTSLALTGSATGGAATYAWAASAGGNIQSGGTTPSPTIDRSGTYTLVATLLANGCTATDVAQVSTDTLAPAFGIQPPLLLTCSQKTVSLIGSVQQPGAGNFTAVWTTQDGKFIPGTTPLTGTTEQPGTYVLTIKNTLNGCEHSEQVLVSQNIVPPTAVAGPAAVLTCTQTTASLNGSGSSAGNPFFYNWTASLGGQILSGNSTLAPTVGKTGLYTLEVSNANNGCTATASVAVTADTMQPLAVIVPPLPLTCVRDSSVLDATGSSKGAEFTYQWVATGGGHFLSQQNPLSPLADAPGQYALTVTDTSNGCTHTATAVLAQNVQSPGADAGPVAELHCNALEINLKGSSPAGAGVIYFWSTPSGSSGNILSGALTATPLVDAPGTYTLRVTDPTNGCTATDQTTVTETPPPNFTPTVWQPDCLDPTGAVDFGAVTGGKSPFRYSVDGGQTYRSSPAFDNLKIGTYFLVVQDAYGCEANGTVDLQLPFTPTVTLPASTLIELGDSVLLVPELNQAFADISKWQWSPSEWLDCTDCPTPEAKPQRRMVYSLKITDKNGCTATAQTEIRVNRRRNLYAPNVFSPNGDGYNDRFMLFGKGTVEVRELAIFDRWGNQLYFDEHLPLNDQTKGWDGNFRGQPMNPAVFVWRAIVVFVDGEVETYFGDVTVER